MLKEWLLLLVLSITMKKVTTSKKKTPYLIQDYSTKAIPYLRPKRLKNHWGRSYPYSHIREYHPGLLMGCIFPLLAPPLSRFPALFTGHATRLLPIVFSSALASGYMFSALCKSLVFWRLPCMCFYVHVLRRVLTCLC